MTSSSETPRAMPFGYAFQDMHEAPSMQAPATARGPALLDDDDAFHMGEFFSRLGTGDSEQREFTFGGSVDGRGNQLFPWSEELPPTFMGSMSTLEPPLSRPAGSKSREAALARDFNPEEPIKGAYGSFLEPPDVLAAASSLVRNHQHLHSSELVNHSFANEQVASLEAGTFPLQHTHQFHGLDHLSSRLYLANHSNGHSSDHEHPSSMLNHGDTVLRDIVLGPSYSNEQSNAITIKHVDLHWGSDQGFFDDGFVPPPHQITVEHLTQSLLGKMECLEPQPSASNSRPSSPSSTHPQKRARDVKFTNSQSSHIGDGINHVNNAASIETGPRAKRRKGKSDQNVEDSEVYDEADGGYGFSLALESQIRGSFPRGSSSKRRSPKSHETPKRSKVSSESRPGRTNLTPVQKKENHVKSEQKRREIIKQGFDDLVDMVPGLHGGGFSKGAILTQAADWLEDLVQGNVQLRRQLAQMEELATDIVEDNDVD